MPERFVAGGEAIGHHSDGRVLFIRGGVPGDRLTVVPLEEKRDWCRVAIEVIERPSEMRVIPPCLRRREGCGGCDWQHVDVAHQLPQKAQIVRDALRRTARLRDPEVKIGSTVPDRGYRTTIRVVGDGSGKPSFRRERSHRTVPGDGCLVAHPRIRDLLSRLELTPGLDLKLRVSVATGELSAVWDGRKGRVSGLGRETVVGRAARIQETVAGHTFRVSAGSFFQSGPAAAEVLVASVKRAGPELADASLVVDAYAGVGLFAATTAPSARLIAIESSKWSAGDCRSNLSGRDAIVERTTVERWPYDSISLVDVVICDPSRAGLGRRGVDSLSATKAPVLVLVSCDPVALARDAFLLDSAGYEHQFSEVHDVFPHTHHVESVSRFTRR